MKVLKHVKDIFVKGNVFAHISIFSILGIMAIFFGNIADLYFDVMYFGFPPLENWEMMSDVLVSVIIFVLFKGYLYDYARALFEDRDALLPEIKVNCIATFFKMFPMYVVWLTYVTLMLIIGMNVFKIINIWSDIYYTVLWCSIPFIWLLMLVYSKNFDIGTSIFNPLPLFSIIKKSFNAVVLFILKTVPAILLIGFLIFKCFIYTRYLANYPSVQLGIRLFLLSLSVYLCAVMSLFYVRGFVGIAKEKELI